MTRIILIRHGETAWNASKRYMGQSDVPLNERGLRQAGELAARLGRESIDAVYSSDLSRAWMTALAIAANREIEVIPTAAFREVNFGHWEGLTYGEIMQRWPKLMQGIYTATGEGGAPGGESLQAVQRRAVAVLQQCLYRHQDQSVVIVTHGGVIRLLLCFVLGLDTGGIWRFRQDQAAINVLDHKDGEWTVSCLNDTSHLRCHERRNG